MIAIEVGIVVSIIAHYFDFGFGCSLIVGSIAMFLSFLIFKILSIRTE